MKKLIFAAIMSALAAGSSVAQMTGGDKGHRLGDKPVGSSERSTNKHSQPPDPLVSHKSPGRNKHSKRQRKGAH